MFNLVTFLSIALILYSVYQLGSLAGIFSERAGVANIAIEGNMIVGAVLFAIIYELLTDGNVGQLESVIASLLIAVPIAATYMCLLSWLTNRYLADHIIAGTGLNLLAPVLMIFAYNILSPTISGDLRAESIMLNISELQAHLNIGGRVNNNFSYLTIAFVVLTLFICVIAAFVLNKTRFGLRLKSSGENPYALETSGVSVAKTRLTALYIAGLLSALAGAIFVTKGTSSFYFTVNGSGFLAIGVLILGQYKVLGTFIGSIVMASFIGFFDTLIVIKGNTDEVFNQVSFLYRMIPFAIPLVGLMIFRKSYVPASVGQNFKKDQR